MCCQVEEVCVCLRDRWHFWEVVSWNVPLERDRMLATVVRTTTTDLFPVCVYVYMSSLIHTKNLARTTIIAKQLRHNDSLASGK